MEATTLSLNLGDCDFNSARVKEKRLFDMAIHFQVTKVFLIPAGGKANDLECIQERTAPVLDSAEIWQRLRSGRAEKSDQLINY